MIVYNLCVTFVTDYIKRCIVCVMCQKYVIYVYHNDWVVIYESIRLFLDILFFCVQFV